MVTSITGLASGYFATLMHLPPGPPIALTTDGVGTKIMLAEEANAGSRSASTAWPTTSTT